MNMSNSRRLRTTHGSFDFPPASARGLPDSTDFWQAMDNSEEVSSGASLLSRNRPYLDEGDNGDDSRLSHRDPELTGQAAESNQTARSTSPETRLRMQRVLRQVHEMQDNADAIRDIQRVLDAQQENQTMMRDIHRRVHELRASQELRPGLRSSTQTLRDAERAMMATRSPIAHSWLRTTAFDDNSTSSQSSITANDNGSPAQSDNAGMPGRWALHDASERLRQVNQELRRLLDRPLEEAPGELQRLSDVHNHLQEYLDRTFDESPDELQDLLQLDRAPSSDFAQRGLDDMHQAGSQDDHQHHNRESSSIGPAESDLQRIFDDAMADVRSRHGTDHSTPRSVLMRDSFRQEGTSQAASGFDQFSRTHERSSLAHGETSPTARPLSGFNIHTRDQSNETWRGSREHRRNMDSSFFPVSSQRSTQSDGDGEQSRHKRRRLNDEQLSDNLPSIKYGYEGQVVPGRLKLQLVSCDGGVLQDSGASLHGPGGAENVLKDDGSMYCTKSQRCNMILQHQQQTTFCLERLVIKAPKAENSDPVQEGLVFVAMRNDEIFNRTARYQIYYFPTSRFASYCPLNAEPTNNSGRDNGTAIRRPGLQPSSDRLQDPLNSSLRSNLPASTLIQQDELSAGDSDDASEDSSGGIPPHILAELNSRNGRVPRTDPPNRTRTQNILAQRVFDNVMARGAAARQRRHRRQLQASSSQTLANVSNSSDPTLDFLTPAASFGMRPPRRRSADVDDSRPSLNTSDEGSDIMTINFDPPVSGKFILLKMWSPYHFGTIGVRNVMAYGFAGPRWFPSEETR